METSVLEEETVVGQGSEGVFEKGDRDWQFTEHPPQHRLRVVHGQLFRVDRFVFVRRLDCQSGE